jgi:hypothetical protein
VNTIPGGQLSFRSADGQHRSPVLHIGSDSPGGDYALALKLVRFHPGSNVHVRLDTLETPGHLLQDRRSGEVEVRPQRLRESPSGNRYVAAVTVRLRGRDSATFSHDHS